MPDRKQALTLRDYSQEKRDEMADAGVALDDGSFPIANGTDLANAVKAMGRSKDPDRVKRHIIKRARALGLVKELPESWEIKASASHVAFSASVAFATAEPEYVEKDGVRYVRGKDQQIFPRGRSRAIDGREVVLDDQNGPALVKDFARREVDLAITFDHEEDKARGSEAAGWAGALEWREDGLYATSVLWTLDAYSEITSGKWRYVSGDAYALGYDTGEPWEPDSKEPAYPVRMLAFTLCPKPALQNRLKSLALATLEGVTPKAATTVGIPTKGKKMDEATMAAVLKALGVTAESSNEEVMAALEKFSAAAAPPEHAEPDGDEGCDHCSDCSGEGGCTNHEGAPAELAAAVPVQTGARKKMADTTKVKTGSPNPMGALTELLAQSEKRQRAQFAADLEAARLKMKAEQEAEAKKEKRESLVLHAINVKRIDLADKDKWIRRLELDFEHESAELEKLPERPASIDAAFSSAKFKALRISGGDTRMPDWEKLGPEESGYILNRTITLATERGVSLATDANRREMLLAVLRGDGADEYEELERIRESRGAIPFRGCRFRAKQPTPTPASFDWDKFEYAREKFKKGDGVATDRIADFHQRVEARFGALERRYEAKFATIAGLTPGAATTIPATIGYAEPNYLANEILEEYVGGATLNANVFTFGQERFYVPVDEAGNRLKTAPTAEPNRSDFDVTPSTVTLDAYADSILIDQMLQDAAVHLPEGLMGIAAKHMESKKNVGREVSAAAFLRSYLNYASGNYDTLSGTRQFDQPTGLPLTEITNQMLYIEGLVGEMPDVAGCDSKVFTGIRRNKEIVEYVKFTGTMARPGTMVPIETLVALFGCRWLVGKARHTTVPGGTPTRTWGQDLILAVTGKGEMSAPRLGYMVTAAGYPLVRTFPMQWRGPAGSDSINITDAYKIQGGVNTAGFLFLNATNLP